MPLVSHLYDDLTNIMAAVQLNAAKLPKDSPLRKTHSLFWGLRTNDEGVPADNTFFGLVKAGKVELIAPVRVDRFGDDGQSVVLDDGRTIMASAIVLATGYESSWKDVMSRKSLEHDLVYSAYNCGL